MVTRCNNFKITLVCLLFIVVIPFRSFSQEKNLDNVLSKANSSFEKKKFKDALPLFLIIEKNNHSSLIEEKDLVYKIAFCYYSSDLEKDKSIPYFLKLFSLSDDVYEPHYYLGKVYQLADRNDEALDQFLHFKKKVELDSAFAPDVIKVVLKAVNRDIACCNYSKFLISHPIKAIVQNLGDTINTPYSEYAPVINPTEEKLVFTRRSPETTGHQISPDGDYFEDVYGCTILEGKLMRTSDFDSTMKTGFQNTLSNFNFSIPQNLGKNINSSGHDAGVAFSYDSKKLFVYKNLQIWVSEWQDEIWQPAHKINELSEVVNKRYFEPSISLSSQENEIYIASEQPGGYGGLDLYKSVKVNGVWSTAINLGPHINTSEDEDSPYIDPNSKILYFSSKGHSSMGGYDVFKSNFDGKNWSVPSNMGYPINSAGDDIFFSMPLKYNRGYYSSNKAGGHGKMDLYRVTFADERPNFAEIRGLVLKGDKFVPTNSSISLLDPFTYEPIFHNESDSISGNYLVLVPHGVKNLLKIETPGFAPVIREFEIPEKVDFFQFYQEIHHVYIKDKKGNIIGQSVSFISQENNSALSDSLTKYHGVLSDKLQTYFSSKNDSAYNNFVQDVKFFYSEDSIAKLLLVDSTIISNFKEGADISFAKPTNGKGDGAAAANYKNAIAGESNKASSINDNTSKNNKARFVTNTEALPLEYTKAKGLKINKKTKYVELKSTFTSDSLEKVLVVDTTIKKSINNSFENVSRIVVLFDYNKIIVQDEFLQKLNVVVDFMKNNPNFYFEISGHSDSKGSNEYNNKLSLARAEAVKKFMLKKGISSKRLITIGKGEEFPIALNENADGSDNEEGRKQNRRIEFRVLKQ